MARARDLDVRVVDRFLGPGEGSGTDAIDTPEGLGALLEATRDAAPGDRWSRKATNLFVTPAALADRMAQALWPSEESLGQALDPACGAGALLLALHRLARSRGQSLGPDQLRGTDVDPACVAVCRCALWLSFADPTLDPEIFERTIQIQDAVDQSPEADAGTVERLIANPPWDLERWDPRPHLERFDPDHRLRSRPDADRMRRELAQDERCQALLDSEHRRFLERARRLRARYPAAEGPGSINLAHLFVARAMELLADRGRAVLLIPSAIRTDLGPAKLRKTLLNEFEIESWLGFENMDRTFARVDTRFRFDLLTIRKSAPRPAFTGGFLMRAENGRGPEQLSIPRALIERLSPDHLAIPEPADASELALLEHIADHGTPLGSDPDWNIEIRREVDLSYDSARYDTLEHFEADGFVGVDDGSWQRAEADGITRTALPLVEGRMIDAFDPDAKNWIEGHGRRARWETVDANDPSLRPQFLIPTEQLRQTPGLGTKVGLMAVGSATNARTAIAAPLLDIPCANSVVTLRHREGSTATNLTLCAVLNSFVYDWVLRRRLSGLNLNRFLLRETLLPEARSIVGSPELAIAVARLAFVHPRHRAAWASLGTTGTPCTVPAERRRARASIDAVVAQAYRLDAAQFRTILFGDDRRGFHRVDAELPAEERLTTLAFEAFERLSSSRLSTADFLREEGALEAVDD